METNSSLFWGLTCIQGRLFCYRLHHQEWVVCSFLMVAACSSIWPPSLEIEHTLNFEGGITTTISAVEIEGGSGSSSRQYHHFCHQFQIDAGCGGGDAALKIEGGSGGRQEAAFKIKHTQFWGQPTTTTSTVEFEGRGGVSPSESFVDCYRCVKTLRPRVMACLQAPLSRTSKAMTTGSIYFT